jgi:hypothetical protein
MAFRQLSEDRLDIDRLVWRCGLLRRCRCGSAWRRLRSKDCRRARRSRIRGRRRLGRRLLTVMEDLVQDIAKDAYEILALTVRH